MFATGDHESLGRPLCGLIPCVRSMRKWFFPNDNGSVPRQFGEPDASPALATMVSGSLKRRLDTTMTDCSDLNPRGGVGSTINRMTPRRRSNSATRPPAAGRSRGVLVVARWACEPLGGQASGGLEKRAFGGFANEPAGCVR